MSKWVYNFWPAKNLCTYKDIFFFQTSHRGWSTAKNRYKIFVAILVETMTSKRHFQINWPLLDDWRDDNFFEHFFWTSFIRFFCDLRNIFWIYCIWTLWTFFLTLRKCKGQLISKCLFGVFNFLQKTNKTSLIVVQLSLFVRFLEETLSRKNNFFWPLLNSTSTYIKSNRIKIVLKPCQKRKGRKLIWAAPKNGLFLSCKL